MISTLANVVAHSLAGLGFLSTPEIVAATGLLAYAVAGLVFIQRLTARYDPVPRSTSRAAALTHARAPVGRGSRIAIRPRPSESPS